MYDKKPFRFYDCSKIDCARFGNDYCECEYDKKNVSLTILFRNPLTNERVGREVFIKSIGDAASILNEELGFCSFNLQKELGEASLSNKWNLSFKDISELTKDIISFVVNQFNVKIA